jgi:hypothetical protein
MNILIDKVYFEDGDIIIITKDELRIHFPIIKNKRLKNGTPSQLNNIEISPCGLHWPDLDEDLSFNGLMSGDFGQKNS